MFLLFLMPVWVALAAPRVFHSPREPIVWPALALALAGLVVILLPDLLGEGVKLSLAGLLAALFTGFGYATYTVSVKGLTKIVAPSTISMAEAAGDTLIVLPLALWQFSSTGYHLDGARLDRRRSSWASSAPRSPTRSGSRARAACASSTSRSSATSSRWRGRCTPSSSSGRCRRVWTVIGGALILGAGLLVVVFGRGEGEASVAAAAEPEPL